MDIAVIIVNFRTAQLTCDCLHSLAQEIDTDKDYAFVVDNNSEDGSLEILSSTIKASGYSNWASLLPLAENRGFAFGNNYALKHIFYSYPSTKFVWLLNPDTIVKKSAGKDLIKFLKGHPSVGICGSRLEDPDGSVQVSAFRHQSFISEFLAGMRLGVLDNLMEKCLVAPRAVSFSNHQVEWVAGASMMVRREVFKNIGLLDEGYFMYFEEEDFCKAAYNAGWECWHVPSSRVIHLVGAASGFSDSRKKQPRRPRYWFESRSRYFLKNHGFTFLFIADTARIVGYALWRIRRIVQNKQDDDPPYFLKDLLKHSVFRKGIFKNET